METTVSYGLVAVLRRLRLRLVAAAWLRGFFVSMTAAFIVYAVGRMAAAVPPLPGNRSYLLLGGSLTLLASVVWAIATAPDLRRVARVVDERTGLDPLLVTSYEAVVRKRASSLPQAALQEEVWDRLGGLDTAKAAPLTPPGRLWALVLVGATLALVPGLQRAVPNVSSPDPMPPESVVEDLVADVVSLAEVLEAAAGVSDYTPLAARLRDIAQELESGAALDGSVARELGEVLSAVAQAAEVGVDETSLALREAFSEAGVGPAFTEQGPQPFTFGGEAQPITDATQEGTEGAASGFDPDSVFRTLGQVAAALDRALSGQGERVAGSGDEPNAAQVGGSGGYYTDWNDEMAEAMAAKRASIRQRGRGEAAAGEASQADDAPGDAAGRGTQAVEAGAAEPDAAGTAIEEMLLEADPREGGRTMTYVPEPRWEQDRVVRAPVVLPSLVLGAEAPVDPERVGAEHAAVVAKYFERYPDTP
jgi:hypothetical protein